MIGFLHTSPVHVPTFDALVNAVDPSVGKVTVVREDLLEVAMAKGPGHAEVLAGVGTSIVELARAGAAIVVCTCSTIGGVAESVGADRGIRVVRVDRPMVEQAIATGGRIVVLAAVESTLGPTEDLLREVATTSGVEPDMEMRLVEGAWRRFEDGDLDGYLGAIAAAIEAAAGTAGVIVLAQASMADAADLIGTEVKVPVLSSPRAAVEAAVEALNRP